MTNMVAGKDISGTCREISKVDYLRPAHQEEDTTNQTTGELGEQAVGYSGGVQEWQEFRSCRIEEPEA
jgi:hypothetical protein